MLNVTQLRERIASEYPDALQIADTVVRFVRSSDDRPYAVCYVDASDNFPHSVEELTKYQDRIIGQHYFQGPRNLQWSNYLYFLTSPKRLDDAEVRRAKELVESDRSYARKFVIVEEELDEVLSPPVVVNVTSDQGAGVLSIWTKQLVESKLDGAILSDDDIPKRLQWIESLDAGGPIAPPKPPRRLTPQPSPPGIQSLQLNRYRPFPIQRFFSFGTVNLIFGPNAAGKTSLLEAIELFYCGRNKRSPDRTPGYEISVVLTDERHEKAATGRQLQIFRDRNLAWYGRPEVKTSNLYQSFAQFNFLDTDAAANIAASTANIEEDLSKLLIGPDASRIWRNMERVAEALVGRLRDLGQLDRNISEEQTSLGSQLQAAATVKHASDGIGELLDELLRRNNWATLQANDREAALTALISSLSELVAIAEQTSKLDWISPPISIAELNAYLDQTADTIREAAPGVTNLELLMKERNRLDSVVQRAWAAAGAADQIKRLFEAGVPERSEAARKLRDEVARLASAVADLETLPSSLQYDESLLILQIEQAATSRHQAEEALVQVRSEYSNFTALRERSISLAQQMREIATEILKGSTTPEECPLCHTRFGPGELAAHMALGVDAHLEARAQQLLSQIRDQESVLAEARRIETAYSKVRAFSERCDLGTKVSLREVEAYHRATTQALIFARRRLAILDAETTALEADGLTQDEFQRASASLADLLFPIDPATLDAATSLISTVARAGSEARTALALQDQLITTQGGNLQDLLHSADASLETSRRALALSVERFENTRNVLDRLNAALEHFPWPVNSSLSELVVTARSVRTVASEFQTALGRERSDLTVQSAARKRKEQLDAQAAALRPTISKLTHAHDTLARLMRDHSLNSAMQSTLQQNRNSIESIFARIHSPAAFSGLGTRFDTLVRKEDGSEASLSEISTGQRAAFALSIFLAQNSQVTSAPPVMLIDDPIAHVDDLNSLSFLDYLREIAIHGQRQIFFATANDKIASLFERKFDFLGQKDFRKIELERE